MPAGQSPTHTASNPANRYRFVRQRVLQLLGRHVLQRSHDVARLRELADVAQLGQSEIGYPDFTAAIEQQVGGLHIAMQNAMAMRVGERTGGLHTQSRDRRKRKRGSLLSGSPSINCMAK